MHQIAAIEIPDAAAEPRAYRRALLALVGDDDPLPALADSTRRLQELVERHTTRDFSRRPVADEWSPAELIGHLMDVEIAMGSRWRMILTADTPAYPGYDQTRWAALPKPPFPQLWPAFLALRAYNHTLLRAIPASDWARVGLHAEAGHETLDETLRAYAGHDLAHLNQLERALAIDPRQEGA